MKPLINREKLKTVKVRAGQNVKFDVDVKGEPAPTITWFFADKALESGAVYRLDNVDYNTKLTMVDTERRHSGPYKIFAENSSGTDEAIVEVHILDRPTKPVGPLDVSNIFKDRCTVEWKPPKDDGGLPLIEYVLEKMDAATGRWQPAGHVDPSKTTHEVTGLEPHHKYQFRVKAVNEEGDSPPLETDHTILAKDPFDAPGAPGLPELVDWNENSVKLKWEPPIRDGGAPIEKYILEVMDKDSGEWVKAAEVPGHQTTGTIPKLEEGQQYKFRVKAVNKAGPSDASEPTNWHTAKARFCMFRFDFFGIVIF